MTRRAIPWDVVSLVALLLAAFGWAMPRHVQAGDAGEFATVMSTGGVPHPSGYPWMRVLGAAARGFEALGVPPASAAALPCGLLAIAGWILLYRTGVALSDGTARRRASWLATALVASSVPVLSKATVSEAFGPLVFFTGWFVHAAVVGRRRPLGLGCLLGTAVCHHLTAVLLVPLAVVAAWPPAGSSRDPKSIGAAAGWGLLGSALGLSMFASLRLGRGGGWRWGDVSTWRGLLHHVTRADYGTFSLSLHDKAVSTADQWARASTSLGAALSGGILQHPAMGAAILLTVLGVAVSRHRDPNDRSRVVALAGCVVLAGWVFPLTFDIDPHSPFGAWILQRFDILPLALLTPLVAVAIGAGLRRLPEGRARGGLTAAIGLLVLRQLISSGWHGVPSGNPWIERYARDVVDTPPGPAIVFGTDDHRTFPILYVQEVLDLRPDVLYVDAALLGYDWYRRRLRARLPSLPDLDKPVELLNAILADPQSADLSLYLTHVFSRPASTIPTHPEGVLLRVERPGSPPPTPEEVARVHRAALRRDAVRHGGPAVPSPVLPIGHPFAQDLVAIYAERTARVARSLHLAGHTAEAEALLHEAAGLSRELPTSTEPR